jgi:hypothetical protein
MALPREISDDLFILCDTLIEGGEEGVESTISGLTREQFGVQFNLRGEGPAGWYRHSTVEGAGCVAGCLKPLVRCPRRVNWCGEVLDHHHG